MKHALAAFALCSIAPFAARAASLTDTQAVGHIGEDNTTICGIVSSFTSSAVLPGRPTYLNFGHDYPNQDFTVVIFGNQRAAVGPDNLAGKRVCVTGSISGYQGKAEMYLKQPEQLQRVKDEKPQPIPEQKPPPKPQP